MKLTEYLLAELDRESNRTRQVLLEVPAGKYDWKPHDRSMKFGNLSDMVSIIPMWITMQLTKDELDIAPADGASMLGEPKLTSAALIQALDASVTAARSALGATTDDHLNTTWQLKAAGKLLKEAPRHQMIQDSFNHWAHHRGQMTVYLRLLGAKVASTYGASADDPTFR